MSLLQQNGCAHAHGDFFGPLLRELAGAHAAAETADAAKAWEKAAGFIEMLVKDHHLDVGGVIRLRKRLGKFATRLRSQADRWP